MGARVLFWGICGAMRLDRRTRIARVVGVLAAVAMAATGTVTAAGAAPSAVSNDPLASQQRALTKGGAAAAWTRTTRRDVLGGVVDTRVDLTHEKPAGQNAATTRRGGTKGGPPACRAGTGGGPGG